MLSTHHATVMTITRNSTGDDIDLIGSRIGRIDPANFENQSGADTDDSTDEETEDNGLFDEPTDMSERRIVGP